MTQQPDPARRAMTMREIREGLGHKTPPAGAPVPTNQPADVITRLRAMHQPRTERHGSGCVQCGIVWPCPTFRVLDEAPATELPDGFERHTCITVKCTACGYAYEESEYLHHFPSVGDALDGPIGSGWDELKDGRVLCEARDEKHDELRRTVIATRR